MTKNQLTQEAEEYGAGWRGDLDWEAINGFTAGFNFLSYKIHEHLQSLPLDQMTGKEVEESLWNEFLHIQ